MRRASEPAVTGIAKTEHILEERTEKVDLPRHLVLFIGQKYKNETDRLDVEVELIDGRAVEFLRTLISVPSLMRTLRAD